jgi:hypothetical protein
MLISRTAPASSRLRTDVEFDNAGQLGEERSAGSVGDGIGAVQVPAPPC